MFARTRRLAAEGFMAGSLILFAVPFAAASSVVPVAVDGNPQCKDLPGALLSLTKFDNSPADGTHEQDGVTITVDGSSLDWESVTPVDAVIMKGGSNSNVYLYDEAISDAGLITATNPRNGQPFDLSHVEFCYDVEDPIVEDPVVGDPIVEDPIVEDPIVEDPIVEDPIVEDPIVEDPVVEDPVVEDPVVEDPGSEEPGSEDPVVAVDLDESGAPADDGTRVLGTRVLATTGSPMLPLSRLALVMLVMGATARVIARRRITPVRVRRD